MNFVTKDIKHYKIRRKGLFVEMMKQFKYYALGIFRKEKNPFPATEERKFNPLQKVSYVIIMFIMIPFVIISGWALLFPDIIIENIFKTSGVLITDLLHVIAGFAISVFLIIHIYVSTLGITPFSHFRSIITGWQESH
jgi:thiosulfate reductase cytochrome b subunit